MDKLLFPQFLQELLHPAQLPPLGPGSPNLTVKPQLSALTVEALFPSHKIINADAARCCLSGLWLFHDFLDESHTLSQEINSTEGSYWHALMHRRELDFGNAKYWFRRVGNHPIFPELARDAAELGYLGMGMRWEPYVFVDHCEENLNTDTPAEETCRKVQLAEWQLLFGWCYKRAIN